MMMFSRTYSVQFDFHTTIIHCTKWGGIPSAIFSILFHHQLHKSVSPESTKVDKDVHTTDPLNLD